MKYFGLLFLLALSLPGFTKEGGNGGGVQVCGKRVELYDFFEGRDARGHNIQIWKAEKNLNRTDYLSKALAHVKKDIPEVSDLVSNMVTKILSTPENDLFVNISIPVIDDANITILGENCQYAQAANWNERFHKLFISREIYSKLDSMNQAGLIIHEAVYKLSRETKVANFTSDAVREVVARIFSNEILNLKDSEVISSEQARIQGTRPQCDLVKSKFAEIDRIFKGKDDASNKDLNHKFAEFCLKWCLIPADRIICEQRLEK